MELLKMISEWFRAWWDNVWPFLIKYLIILSVILILRLFSFWEFKDFMIAIVKAYLWTIPIILSVVIITLFYPILFMLAVVLGWILIFSWIIAVFKLIFDKINKTYKISNIYHKK